MVRTSRRREVLTAALAASGAAVVAPAMVTAAQPRLSDALAEARSIDRLHAIAIAHQGETVAAEGMHGHRLETPANLKSLSKTLLATMVGVAIERGFVAGTDQPVVELLAPGRVPADADPRVRQITVGHLLSMRAGLERTSGEAYGAWVTSDNWTHDALRRPFVAEPGGEFRYSTGDWHILAAALTDATGESLLVLARSWLGAPLEITIPPWERSPEGVYMGGNNMHLSPLGLLRFGEMARRGGTLDGRRIVQQSWIATCWTARAESPWSGDFYGYGWFLREPGGRAPGMAYGRGYGGQMLYVFPRAEVTVVITSDPTRPAHSDGYINRLDRLVLDSVLPAVTGDVS